MTRGRPIRGIFGGFLLGICIDLDLIFGGFAKLDSALLTILPLALLVVGFALGMWAPVGRTRNKVRAAAASGQVLPPPKSWPDFAPTEGSTPPPPFGSNLGGEAPPPPPPPPPI
jgi:hypothetical protein